MVVGKTQHFGNNKVKDVSAEVHFSGRSSKFVLTRATFCFEASGGIEHAKFSVISYCL